MLEEEKKMKFRVNSRMNEKTFEAVRWLMHNFPELYENESHLIRCAILLLQKTKKEELTNGLQRTT